MRSACGPMRLRAEIPCFFSFLIRSPIKATASHEAREQRVWILAARFFLGSSQPCHVTPPVCGRFPNTPLQRGTCEAQSRRKTEPRCCFGREEGRKGGEDESTPLSVIPGREPGGQSRGAASSYGSEAAPALGKKDRRGEGAVFFFCPNNLINFASAASGIEISSRYTVCLCLINVNLPRAPTMPQALRCLALR